MVFVSIFSSEKNLLQIGKQNVKNLEKFFITLLAKKIQSEKFFDITFSLKRSLHKPQKPNKTMNPILVSVMRYTSSSKKEPRIFFEIN